MRVYGNNNVAAEMPMPDERVPEGHLPYHWDERREGVMKRMPNVLNWVQPIGSTVPYQQHGSDGDDSRELAWLIRTQHMELAPQWREFAANGLNAASRHNTENGEEADVLPDQTEYSTALAETFENGRREQWARERDYQTWHTEPVRRANVSLKDDGKYKAVVRYGSEFERSELLHLIEQVKVSAAQPAPPPLTREWSDELDWLDNLDRDPKREMFRIADEQERYDEDRVGYAAGEPCPMKIVTQTLDTGITYPLCDEGQAPIFAEEACECCVPALIYIVLSDHEPCQTCYGTGLVQNLLGTVLPVTDGDELLTL